MDAVYPSDLTDAEWSLLQSMMPRKTTKRGRPREIAYRTILNAIFYVNKEGCQWRALPREYCAWQTAYYYFRKWRRSGLWPKIHSQIRGRVRAGEGRSREPSAAIIDSQSVKTTQKRGREAMTPARR